MASEAAWSLYCNRILIVNNSLFVQWAHQDQADAHTSFGRKWYSIALTETLTSLTARVRVPDVDICVAEEGPQLLRGGNQPMFAATRSAAHMDILVPDLFFRYWETEAERVPHPWYKPPRNLAKDIRTDGGGDGDVGAPWQQRRARVYWRGSVDEWAMNARGRLCRLAARRPDLFDVQPVRVTGRALHQWALFPNEETLPFEAAIRRGGGGVQVNATEILEYKFVINIHGNGNEWSNRFRMLLSSGALVFKQVGAMGTHCSRERVCVCARARVRARARAQSVCAEKGGVCMHHSIAVYACTETYGAVSSTPNSDVALGRHQESTLFEFWERDLEPYQHYVPVKADFSDLIEKVEWAITHDDDARAIARNGAQFVREHLHMTRVHCYWARLLSRYSALQDFKPQVPPDAVAVVNLASSLWNPPQQRHL